MKRKPKKLVVLKAKQLPPITFKNVPADDKRIRDDARDSGMSLSSYIRSRLLDAPQTKTIYRRTQLRRLIIRLIGHIGRVGNNMNQIAHKLNLNELLNSIDRKLHEEGIMTLKEMRALLIDFLLQDKGC